ncbi:MAG: helix-turn-helix transcriptional regulator [Cellulosilyticaceae bacterium]
MSLNIGQVIKQLRVAQSITQEKLADYLNVTPQSISKWENGMSYPDITLIPTIAMFFNVTADELFSLPTAMNEQKLKSFQLQYEQLRKQGAVREQVNLCRQIFLEYPRNYVVMSHLAHALVACYEGLDLERQWAKENNYLVEAIKLGELILEDCKDTQLQLGAIRLLCTYYPLVGDGDKALTLAERLTPISLSKEMLLEEILSGDACIKQQQSNLLRFAEYIDQTLIHLSFTKGKSIEGLSMKEKMHFVETANQIYKLIISDENYLYYHSKLAWNHRRLAELYLGDGNEAQCLEALGVAFHHAKAYDQLPTCAKYTAPLVTNCEFNKEAVCNNWEGNECKMLYDRLTEQGTFGILEMHPEFQKLVQEVTKWAIQIK